MLGNEFILNIKVGFAAVKTIEIKNTVDYTHLYSIAKEHFGKPVKLLEELTLSIAESIKEQFPFITYEYVSIRKLNPPVTGGIESAEVVFEKRY